MESESVAWSPVEILSDPPKDSKYDNFYTPKNDEFYSKQIYAELDATKRNICLLRMRPLLVTDDGTLHRLAATSSTIYPLQP